MTARASFAFVPTAYAHPQVHPSARHPQSQGTSAPGSPASLASTAAFRPVHPQVHASLWSITGSSCTGSSWLACRIAVHLLPHTSSAHAEGLVAPVLLLPVGLEAAQDPAEGVLEVPELPDPPLRLGELPADDGGELGVVRSAAPLVHVEELPGLGEAEAQELGPEDPIDPPKGLLVVEAVPGRAPGRLHQPVPLVEPEGLPGDPGPP